MKKDIAAATIITNSVTINSNETAPTTTSVDVILGNNPLNLKKSILVPDSIEGQVTQVESGDTIIYAIDFDNNGNDFPVTEISIVDTLSKDVTFINAKDQDGKEIGKYEDKEHIWTWSIESVEPKEEIHVELEVSVNPDLPLDTTITNIVTIDCNEAPPSSTSVDAVISYKPLNITKKAMDSSEREIEWIEPGKSFTYKICFDNNNNDSKVTDVFIVDKLPDEVTFVMAEGGKATGKYDEKAHTYTWSYGSLDPGITNCVELVVDVNENTPLGIMIANSVTIDSNETLPATAVHDLPVGEILMEIDDDNLSVIPDVLKRSGTSRNIMVVIYPQEFNKIDIDENIQPELYYQDRNTNKDKFNLITKGSLSLSGSEDRPKITMLFNRAKLMDALYGYGEFKLRVMGKLKSERIYYGDAIIHVTRFAGY